eukprot:CAMPEP_0119547422 /NCGR_PEP_ID=MMETSP1352-20130426/1551_1 /TAXON_ID=265584 /ORGANISM="Stauroneis constricta, Strain CCMP1120" /LENGTH=113 /DNA_ID=CAMNT_0007592345 /DNA_START=42 /DNA_END=383 /DNA_ORIENTATION=-
MTKLTFDNLGEFSTTHANEVFESHKKYLEWRKKEWATRGPDALAQRQAARAATNKTWRQMKGFDLFRHEVSHHGNRPFTIGVGVMAGVYLLASMSQTAEYRKEAEYWSKYHGK